MSIYKQASKENLLITTDRGVLTVSQLWTAPENVLISCEENLQEQVNKLEQTSRRKQIIHSKSAKTLVLSLAIVTDILDTRIKDAETLSLQVENRKYNAGIDAIIAEKQNLAMKNLSIEELEKLRK